MTGPGVKGGTGVGYCGRSTKDTRSTGREKDKDFRSSLVGVKKSEIKREAALTKREKINK